MFLSRIYLAASVSLLVWGCNGFRELNPTSGKIPAETVEVVKNKYPDASELEFKVLTEQRIWQANFNSNKNRHIAVVNRSAFLSDARMSGSGVPDSLRKVIEQLSISGGTFMNFREIAPTSVEPGIQFMADYSWNGSIYTIRWVRHNVTMAYTVFLYPQTSIEFFPDDYTGLPPRMHDLYKGGDFWKQLGRVKVYINADGAITYRDLGLSAPYSTVALFDQQGNLLYSKDPGNISDPMQTPVSELDLYPVAMQQYIREVIQPSGIKLLLIQRFDQNGQVGYYASDSPAWIGYESPELGMNDGALWYQQGLPVYVDAWHPTKEVHGFYFDAKGSLVYRSFCAQVFN